MNFLDKIARNRYWFIPTKREQIGYRKEELALIADEKMKALEKMQNHAKKSADIEGELLKTFNLTQDKLFLDLKVSHKNELFWGNHFRYSEERETEIPREIENLKS